MRKWGASDKGTGLDLRTVNGQTDSSARSDAIAFR